MLDAELKKKSVIINLLKTKKFMQKQKDFDLDYVLSFLSEEIDHLRSRMKEVQEELGDVTKGKAVLFCDASFDYSPNALQRQKKEAEAIGFGEVFRLYEQKVFNGKLPESAVDIIKLFFGPHVPVEHWSLKTGNVKGAGREVGAVILGGSPANVSFAWDEKLKNQKISQDIEKTHLEVYDFVSSLYRQAVKNNLPAIGICYGHQVIAKECGSDVVRKENPRAGYFPVQVADVYGEALLKAATGMKKKIKPGFINTYHSDMVKVDSHEGVIFLDSQDVEPSVVQGMIHIHPSSGKAFVGDKKKDAALIKEMMAAQKHVAISTQAHPEVTEFKRLSSILSKEGFGDLSQTYKKIIAPDLLRVFLLFLKTFYK